MNTGRFHSPQDRFPFLGLTAQFEFKTDGSIALLLGEGPSHRFNVLGRAEVHHPCVDGFGSRFKVRMRVSLPAHHLTEGTMMEAIQTLYKALEIPEEDAHQVQFIELGPRTLVVQDGQPVACVPMY